MSLRSRSSRGWRRGANAPAPGRFRPPSAATRNIRTSRRVTLRRCANGMPCARRPNRDPMVEMAEADGQQSYVWGPLTPLGLTIALLAGVADQVSKLWLLYGFDLESRVPVAIAPFVDLVVTWNSGISYGLFQQRELLGAWALLAFKAVVVIALWAWLARASSRLTAGGLGLIIGGGGWQAHRTPAPAGRSATPSTGCTGRESWISCFSTWKQEAGTSAALCLTLPM